MIAKTIDLTCVVGTSTFFTNSARYQNILDLKTFSETLEGFDETETVKMDC